MPRYGPKGGRWGEGDDEENDKTVCQSKQAGRAGVPKVVTRTASSQLGQRPSCPVHVCVSRPSSLSTVSTRRRLAPRYIWIEVVSKVDSTGP